MSIGLPQIASDHGVSHDMAAALTNRQSRLAPGQPHRRAALSNDSVRQELIILIPLDSVYLPFLSLLSSPHCTLVPASTTALSSNKAQQSTAKTKFSQTDKGTHLPGLNFTHLQHNVYFYFDRLPMWPLRRGFARHRPLLLESPEHNAPGVPPEASDLREDILKGHLRPLLAEDIAAHLRGARRANRHHRRRFGGSDKVYR